MPPTEPVSPTPTTTAPDAANPTPTEPASTTDLALAITETSPVGTAPSPTAPTEAASSAPTTTAPTRPPRNEPELNAAESTPVSPEPLPTPPTGSAPDVTDSIPVEPTPTPPVVQVLRHEPLSLERAVEVAARPGGRHRRTQQLRAATAGRSNVIAERGARVPLGDTPRRRLHVPRAGRAAVAALDGHVVVAVGDYENPSPAHLDALDAAIGIGRPVEAGQLLGWVGNSGTNTAAAGALDWSLHLHWELHVDGQYVGAGLSPSETRSVYAALFGVSTD